MKRYILLGFCFIQLLFLLLPNFSKANERCIQFKPIVKQAFQRYFKNFPYWYSVALLDVESSCKWIESLDGHGSIGYAQLTPKFLDADGTLSKLFPDWKKPYSSDYFYAFAYVLFYKHTKLNRSPDKKLWLTYQIYNAGIHPVLDCERVNSWDWGFCQYSCFNCRDLGGQKCRGEVCVWKVNGVCKQKRHACDINYKYSVKVWEYSYKYREKIDNLFW